MATPPTVASCPRHGTGSVTTTRVVVGTKGRRDHPTTPLFPRSPHRRFLETKCRHKGRKSPDRVVDHLGRAGPLKLVRRYLDPRCHTWGVAGDTSVTGHLSDTARAVSHSDDPFPVTLQDSSLRRDTVSWDTESPPRPCRESESLGQPVRTAPPHTTRGLDRGWGWEGPGQSSG